MSESKADHKAQKARDDYIRHRCRQRYQHFLHQCAVESQLLIQLNEHSLRFWTLEWDAEVFLLDHQVACEGRTRKAQAAKIMSEYLLANPQFSPSPLPGSRMPTICIIDLPSLKIAISMAANQLGYLNFYYNIQDRPLQLRSQTT
jgi:hypothetical protein